MHHCVTEEGKCKQKKNGADHLVPNDPRRPHHFGDNSLCERASVVRFYRTDKFDCIDESHHGFMLTPDAKES